MLFMPAKLVTDHFGAPATPMLEFWIRGSSSSLLLVAYCVNLLPTDQALQVATLSSVSVGVLYPWNAKMGYLSPGLPTKYPMHYVPEVST